MQELFNPKKREQARLYSRVKYRSFVASTLVALLYNICFVILGWGTTLSDWLIRSIAEPVLQVQGFIWIYVGGWFLLATAINYFLGYRYQHRFGLSVQSSSDWVLDQIKRLTIILFLASLGLSLVYWLIANFPATWWIQAWAGFGLFMLITMFIAPVVIMPLFNKFTPLGAGPLQQRLLEMARLVGANIEGVYVMDMSRRTTGLNAMFTGIGSTRRIILGDTMLKQCSQGEIEVVLAHELGHYHFNHLFKIYFLSVVVAGAALSLTWQVLGVLSDLPAMAVLPLLVLVFQGMMLVLKPFNNTISRNFEIQCDQFALEMTRDPISFMTVMAKLADANLADIDPPYWLEYIMYSHPSIANRIRHAKNFQQGM